jgi:hypothetical protein
MNAFLIARRTAVTLIVVLLVLMALGYVLPQQTVTGPGPNRLGMPESVLAISAAIGFDRMWSSAVFLGTLGACLVSLTAALIHSARLAWRRSTAPVVGAGSLGAQHVAARPDVVATHLRASGYRATRPVDGTARFIRHPWGLWGGFVLHLGLVITTAAAIVVLSTETWAIVGLAESEAHASGSPWSAEEPARFAGPIVLPEDLRLDTVTVEYWDNHDLRQVTSDLTFISPDSSEVPITVSVNGSRVFRGVRFFQDQQFGRAFFIEIERDGELLRERVEMSWPIRPAEPVYFDLTLDDGATLQLKHYADASHESMTGEPELWGRWTQDGVSTESVVLPQGAPVQVGPALVELKFHRIWTNIILVRDHGIPVLFGGFFLVFIGSGLIYLTVPREAFVAPETDGGSKIWLRAARFPEMYAEEFDSLIARMRAESEGSP